MVVGPIKTLILGAGGMLGSDLCLVFSDAVAFTRDDLDITDREMVIRTIEDIGPDVVINSAAYTDVDGCEGNLERAFDVNGYALGFIAERCFNIGAVLVHFSTDYVFDGLKRKYLEADTTTPINVYGESKLMGERKIIQNMDNYRIVRTSWLFGKHGNNFVDTRLRLSSEMDSVKVVNDQVGKPTYTLDLAYKIEDVIDMNLGIYHITNEGICSWYEFAAAIIDNIVPCESAEISRKAKRPICSVLINTKTDLMRHWKEALTEYLK